MLVGTGMPASRAPGTWAEAMRTLGTPGSPHTLVAGIAAVQQGIPGNMAPRTQGSQRDQRIAPGVVHRESSRLQEIKHK
jgi:hypothetical protein